MNSFMLKIVLILCLVMQAGCDITFKRKYNKNEQVKSMNAEQQAVSVKKNKKVTAEKISAVKEVKAEKKIVKKEGKKEKLTRSKKNTKPKSYIAFTKSEKKLIRTYFKDRANNRILHYAIKRSPISKKQDKKLRISNYIPSDVQIVPLPMELGNMLRQIPLSMLRVQVGKNIILMKVNSRKILDIVKL